MLTIQIIIYIFLLFNVSVINTLYLNKIQQTAIIDLIKNNKLSIIEREKINNILFEAYKDCAHKKASFFKHLHKYKCRNININDLISASEVGLMKATIDYNGNSSFYYYSSLHIKNELLNTLTEHNSISGISKTTLRKGFSQKTPKFSLNKYYLMQNKLNVIYESITNPMFLNTISMLNRNNVLDDIIQKEEHEQLWNDVLSNLPTPLMREIFKLKYDKEFKIIRSTKEISKIIGYSQNHIILNIRKIKEIINSKIVNTTKIY
jgi:RNA polymerase sigma factor (sigma-70 family)